MAKTNLAFRGHLLSRPPVERKSCFSGQPGVYDMNSLGIGRIFNWFYSFEHNPNYFLDFSCFLLNDEHISYPKISP